MKCCSQNSIHRIAKFYLKYSLLTHYDMNNTNNMSDFIFTGPVFSDYNCTKQIGEILGEQTYNSTTNFTKATHTIKFPNGIFSYMLYYLSNNGKALTGQSVSGPMIGGNRRYTFWSAKNYTVNMVVDNEDIRTIRIFKSNF